MKSKQQMTVAEAGRKGGRKVRRERGLAYFEAIGRMGGASNKVNAQDAAAYRELRELGLLPTEARIEKARAKVRAAASKMPSPLG